MLCLVAFAADELQLSVGWQYDKNGRKRILGVTSTNYDVTGNGVIENVQTISTAAAGDALTMGGVTNAGFAWFNNLSTNRTIQIGCYDVNTNFLAFLSLSPGEKAECWLATSTPRAKAITASAKLDYVIVDR
jgi:hypothetical protein